MHINFPMWRKASWQLIKMDDKKEWDSLDIVSKWLIVTRSAVTLVTVYSCVIAGLLAWRDGNFSWLPFMILTLGLFIAHGTNNILNDYTDYSRGLDTDNYFRTQYGVHPLAQGFFTKPQQIQWFVVSGILATLAGIYALFYSHFNPAVFGLFAFGAITLLAYTYPFKYWGLGELAIFLIWGPIMIGGVYLTMALIKGGDISNVWNVVLAGIPYGLGVASINIGKHIDKHDDDKARGVGTFPVRVGEAFARRVDQAALLLIYAVIGLFAFGAITLLAYTYPFKYWGLGELAIFLIWGPIMIGGVYLTMALIKGGDISNVWNVVLAGIPYGLGVASINIGKHIDKHDDDKARGVGTFPVRVGEAFARRVDQAALVLIYAVIVYLVFVPHYFTPVMLIVFLAFQHALNAIKVLNSPRPKQPPQGYPVWPTWFSAVTFFHNRKFGGWLILGLIVDTLLHVIPFTADLIARYWLPM